MSMLRTHKEPESNMMRQGRSVQIAVYVCVCGGGGGGGGIN